MSYRKKIDHTRPMIQRARRWHKCRSRVRQRKAGWSWAGVVYIDGTFSAPRPPGATARRFSPIEVDKCWKPQQFIRAARGEQGWG